MKTEKEKKEYLISNGWMSAATKGNWIHVEVPDIDYKGVDLSAAYDNQLSRDNKDTVTYYLLFWRKPGCNWGGGQTPYKSKKLNDEIKIAIERAPNNKNLEFKKVEVELPK